MWREEGIKPYWAQPHYLVVELENLVKLSSDDCAPPFSVAISPIVHRNLSLDPPRKKLSHQVSFPTCRSYFWEIPSKASLYCRDSHNLCFAKPLRKPLQIQTAECGMSAKYWQISCRLKEYDAKLSRSCRCKRYTYWL